MNGSFIDVENCCKYFNNFGISLDTLDVRLANKIGRFNLIKVLLNIEKLLIKFTKKDNIRIFITDFGQDLTDLIKYIDSKGMKYNVKSVRTKKDYTHIYSGILKDKIKVRPTLLNPKFECDYITGYNKNYMFYSIDGVYMPCCFIKDRENFISVNYVRDCFKKKVIPKCCDSCSYFS